MARAVWSDDEWESASPWAIEVVPLLGGGEFEWTTQVLIGERSHVRSGVAGTIEDAATAARVALGELRDDGQLNLCEVLL